MLRRTLQMLASVALLVLAVGCGTYARGPADPSASTPDSRADESAGSDVGTPVLGGAGGRDPPRRPDSRHHRGLPRRWGWLGSQRGCGARRRRGHDRRKDRGPFRDGPPSSVSTLPSRWPPPGRCSATARRLRSSWRTRSPREPGSRWCGTWRPADVYDRLLGYIVRSSDGLFVNLELVAAGYAAVLSYPPNDHYADVLDRAQAEAVRLRPRAVERLWGSRRAIGLTRTLPAHGRRTGTVPV